VPPSCAGVLRGSTAAALCALPSFQNHAHVGGYCAASLVGSDLQVVRLHCASLRHPLETLAQHVHCARHAQVPRTALHFCLQRFVLQDYQLHCSSKCTAGFSMSGSSLVLSAAWGSVHCLLACDSRYTGAAATPACLHMLTCILSSTHLHNKRPPHC
jgi:hypothetical protein